MMEDDTNDDSTDGKYAESPSVDIPRQKGSKAYLSPLMAQGYIAQTLPKKPKSPCSATG